MLLVLKMFANMPGAIPLVMFGDGDCVFKHFCLYLEVHEMLIISHYILYKGIFHEVCLFC